MARFTGFQDWQGDRFDGNYDGRPARLNISVLPAPWAPGRFTIGLHFADDAGNAWMLRPEIRDFAADEHTLRDLTLEPPLNSGRNPIRWPRLFIHTWDVNFLSGASEWNGREYGMFWTRNPRR